MKTSAPNVLVLTPYTKRLGVAVFHRGELIYFGVKTFRRPRTSASISDETSEKLSELLANFKPELVIVKSLTKHQAASDNHQLVLKTIRLLADIAEVRIKEVSFEEAREELFTTSRPTKLQAFTILRKQYPDLARFVQFQNRSQEEYYTPMLAAIIIGVAQIGRETQI